MAFYQPVKPGAVVHHSARRENDISAMLNQFNGFSANTTRAGTASAFRIAVYNSTQSVIPAGYAVEIAPAASSSAEALPVKIATGISDFYAVATENMQPADISSAVVMGVVAVVLAKRLPDGCRFVAPDGGKFAEAAGSRAQVISSQETEAVILLGGSAGGYTGNFEVTLDSAGKLRVGPGWLNRNGFLFGWVEQSETGGIAPKTGVLCITSRPVDKKGNWSDPVCEIRDAPNQLSYPIAEITVEETTGADGKTRRDVRIRQFPVTVATILYSVRCPLAEL